MRNEANRRKNGKDSQEASQRGGNREGNHARRNTTMGTGIRNEDDIDLGLKEADAPMGEFRSRSARASEDDWDW